VTPKALRIPRSASAARRGPVPSGAGPVAWARLSRASRARGRDAGRPPGGGASGQGGGDPRAAQNGPGPGPGGGRRWGVGRQGSAKVAAGRRSRGGGRCISVAPRSAAALPATVPYRTGQEACCSEAKPERGGRGTPATWGVPIGCAGPWHRESAIREVRAAALAAAGDGPADTGRAGRPGGQQQSSWPVRFEGARALVCQEPGNELHGSPGQTPHPWPARPRSDSARSRAARRDLAPAPRSLGAQRGETQAAAGTRTAFKA
jgi:hypothetical protein